MVEWFRYELDDNVEENIRAFSHLELVRFRIYTVDIPFNFGGGKDYFTVTQDSLPIGVMDGLTPNEHLMFPSCFILKPKPNISRSNLMSSFMEIVLLDEHGREKNDYNLDFGVIGKVVVS